MEGNGPDGIRVAKLGSGAISALPSRGGPDGSGDLTPTVGWRQQNYSGGEDHRGGYRDGLSTWDRVVHPLLGSARRQLITPVGSVAQPNGSLESPTVGLEATQSDGNGPKTALLSDGPTGRAFQGLGGSQGQGFDGSGVGVPGETTGGSRGFRESKSQSFKGKRSGQMHSQARTTGESQGLGGSLDQSGAGSGW